MLATKSVIGYDSNGIRRDLISEIDIVMNTALGIATPLDIESLSWKMVDFIARSGRAHLFFKIGDKKSMTLLTGEVVKLVIVAFNHDNLTSGGKAGITFVVENCLKTLNSMSASASNSGGWASCTMRTSTLQTVLTQIPDEVRTRIKSVKKLTSAGSASSAINETNDTLFLLSHKEISGTNMRSTTSANSYAGEGEQYEYFKTASIPAPTSGNGAFLSFNGTGKGSFYTSDAAVATGYLGRFSSACSTTVNVYYNYNNAKGAGNTASSSVFWWLRSPGYGSTNGFCYIPTSGSIGFTTATNSYGVAFGLCY